MPKPNELIDSAKLVQIDETRLDKECLQLASIFLQASHYAADRRRDLDEIEAEISVLEADLGKRIRDMPAKYGLEKATVDAVKNAIETNEGVQKLQKDLRDVKHKATLAMALVSALDHKKRALEMLVNLHGMGYFAEPRPGEKGKEVVEEQSRNRARRLREIEKED